MALGAVIRHIGTELLDRIEHLETAAEHEVEGITHEIDALAGSLHVLVQAASGNRGVRAAAGTPAAEAHAAKPAETTLPNPPADPARVGAHV